MPKLYIAADHAGFALKEALIPLITELGHDVEDMTPMFLERDDYPDAIRPCAERVAADRGSFGIVIGASGQGEAMVANRISGVRAAVFYGNAGGKQTDASGGELDIIAGARVHNDANVLSLGARFLSISDAIEAVRAFVATPFSGEERHVQRIAKLG